MPRPYKCEDSTHQCADPYLINTLTISSIQQRRWSLLSLVLVAVLLGFLGGCGTPDEPTPTVIAPIGHVYVKSQTPIVQLEAYAKTMALKRPQMLLAKNVPEARQQYLLAHKHLKAKRYDQAEALLVTLAEQGYADVQQDLSAFYAPKSPRTPVSYHDGEKRLYWLEKALDQGLSTAQHTYGLTHYNRSSINEIDWGKYVDWLRIAAEQGNAYAQSSLGTAYSSAIGLERDLVQAYKWYELAIRRFKPPPADTEKNTIAVSINSARFAQGNLVPRYGMTPEQIEEAKRLVAEWEASHPYAYQSVTEIEHIVFRRDPE